MATILVFLRLPGLLDSKITLLHNDASILKTVRVEES